MCKFFKKDTKNENLKYRIVTVTWWFRSRDPDMYTNQNKLKLKLQYKSLLF